MQAITVRERTDSVSWQNDDAESVWGSAQSYIRETQGGSRLFAHG